MAFYIQESRGINTIVLKNFADEKELGSEELKEYIKGNKSISTAIQDHLLNIVGSTGVLLNKFYFSGGILASSGEFLVCPLDVAQLSSSLLKSVLENRLIEDTIKRFQNIRDEEDKPRLIFPQVDKQLPLNQKVILASPNWAVNGLNIPQGSLQSILDLLTGFPQEHL
jgi:hypothetical protein